MSEQGLADRVALVTGASRGIGAAIADRLAADGATVYGTATGDAGATAVTQRLAAFDPPGQGLRLDVNDAEQIDAALARIRADAGPVEILVNNAGVARDQLLLRMSDDDWSTVLDTNLRSVYRLSKACLRGMMKARWGRIVSIASVVGFMGNAGQSNYAAAKAGIGGFTRSIAREVGSRGITANVVAPGFIETDMTGKLDDQQRQKLLDGLALPRLGSVEDVSAAVAFLVSSEAGYITGETLHVNGGMYMQ